MSAHKPRRRRSRLIETKLPSDNPQRPPGGWSSWERRAREQLDRAAWRAAQ